MSERVSILIPAFNAEAWIGETLESALSQTWPATEVIVVDDGSRDRTAAVVATFASRGVKLIAQPNAGAAAARNRAYAASTGRFIQWLDADDVLGREKVARQMKVLLAAGDGRVVAAGPWGRFLARPERALFDPTVLWQDLPPAEWMVRRLESNAYMQTASWLVSRELSDQAGPWSTDLLGDDDGEYFSRVLAKASFIRFVPDARVYYRMPSSGHLSYLGRSKAKLEAQRRSMVRTIACLRMLDDSPRARAACVTYLQNWLGPFLGEDPEGAQALRELAEELGGTLRDPELGWKYRCIERTCGAGARRSAQLLLPQIRWAVARRLDSLIWRVQRTLRLRSPAIREQV